MYGAHVWQILNRLAKTHRPHVAATVAGTAAAGVLLLGLSWFFGGPSHPVPNESEPGVLASPAVALAPDVPKPAWPGYLPQPEAAARPLRPESTLPESMAMIRAAVQRPARGTAAPAANLFRGGGSAPSSPGTMASRPGNTPPRSHEPQERTVAPARPQVQLPPAGAAAPRHAAAAPVRSEEMEKIASQADEKVRRGLELANRGAYFAARAEFTAALRMIAQGLDNDAGGTGHSEALRAALTAMSEAQDFVPAGGRVEGEIEIGPLVASHRTPLLKNAGPQPLPPMKALKQYLTFAQERFAAAGGSEVSASMALGGLGKIHVALAGKLNPDIPVPEAKAIVFFQAAILVFPRNHIAANDLGVLLAHKGDYANARRALEQSVLCCRGPENLGNLGTVYRRLGEQRLADLAFQKANAAHAAEIARQKTSNLSAGGTVQWIDPETLARTGGQWSDLPPRQDASKASQPPAGQPVLGQPPPPFGPSMKR